MAKKVWDLKHSKITLTSNRREIIVEYKNDESFKRSVWKPIEHSREDWDYDNNKLKSWTTYISMGCLFVRPDEETCGCLGNLGMFHYLRHWVNHTATYKKLYGYFDENVPTYVLQMLDCYLLEDVDWKPEEYNLSRSPVPEDVDDLVIKRVTLV